MVIGIDFDNTIVNYDLVFFHKAVDLGLIKEDVSLNSKKLIRDQIRLLPDGENLWQKLQSHVYTDGMVNAHLIDGVKDFFISCKKAKIPTYIVSHKTMYANGLVPQVNLREIALDWMKCNRFFDPKVLGLQLDQVYFESSRLEKIDRIKKLGCTHFIDDLLEVFVEKSFPLEIEKILYSQEQDQSVEKDITVAKSWKIIHEYIFK